MALVAVHQWRELDQGLQELRRVTRKPIIVLTFDGDALDRYWLADYAPELIAVKRRRYPGVDAIAKGLGGWAEVQVIPIPIDCVDGFTEAYYAPPARRRVHRQQRHATRRVARDALDQARNTVGKVTVSGLNATGVYRSAISVKSWVDEPITNVVLRNVQVEFAGGGTASQAQGPVKGPGVDARSLPAWGSTRDMVQTLTLEDVRFSLASDDFRPVVHADRVEQLNLDGMKFTRVPVVNKSSQRIWHPCSRILETKRL